MDSDITWNHFAVWVPTFIWENAIPQFCSERANHVTTDYPTVEARYSMNWMVTISRARHAFHQGFPWTCLLWKPHEAPTRPGCLTQIRFYQQPLQLRTDRWRQPLIRLPPPAPCSHSPKLSHSDWLRAGVKTTRLHKRPPFLSWGTHASPWVLQRASQPGEGRSSLGLPWESHCLAWSHRRTAGPFQQDCHVHQVARWRMEQGWYNQGGCGAEVQSHSGKAGQRDLGPWSTCSSATWASHHPTLSDHFF